MSLLTASLDDVQPRNAKRLPDGIYRVTVEAANVQDIKGNPTFHRQYGTVRTKDGATEKALADGSTFSFGNRKLFKNSWIDHTNPDAAAAGMNEIRAEAISAGLMQKPTKEQPSTELPFNSWVEYAAALVGRDVIVQVRGGKPYVSKKTGETVTDAEISSYLLP